MRISGAAAGLAVGVLFGLTASVFYFNQVQQAGASSNDRFQDFVMATGPVTANPRAPMDGVWLLDYRSGKLLGTVIDKSLGKIVGWAEVDLVSEFQVAPRQDVHFMMVTGWVSQGQSALYVAEVNTGKFGVYSMTPGINGAGVVIRRHDMTTFRQGVNMAEQPVPGEIPEAVQGQPGGQVPAQQPAPAPQVQQPAVPQPNFPQPGQPAPAPAPAQGGIPGFQGIPEAQRFTNPEEDE